MKKASYRDPNLEQTYAVYDRAADYVASLELDERELTKYIIGAIGAVDAPMTASMKGARSLAAYMSNRSYEQIQKTRDELLGTTVEELHQQAAAVRAVTASGHICVVGSESSIRAQKERFEHVTQLLIS